MRENATEQRIIALVGTDGIPARYGGFETLVENLVAHSPSQREHGFLIKVSVISSSWGRSDKKKYLPANDLLFENKYVPIPAHGIWAIFYDAYSVWLARNVDCVVLFGVSFGSSFACLKRKIKKIIHIDGRETARQKWGGIARSWLKFNEWMAVKLSDLVICDNKGIQEEFINAYPEFAKKSIEISYGAAEFFRRPKLVDEKNCLTVCRIEPENNIEMMLKGFLASKVKGSYTVVGNWGRSKFSRRLREKYEGFNQLNLIDPIWESASLLELRKRHAIYLHGHSVGGTNPSLVEAMAVSQCILAFDCKFNRYTTDSKATYFQNDGQLATQLQLLSFQQIHISGATMHETANSSYVWDKICASYYSLLLSKK